MKFVPKHRGCRIEIYIAVTENCQDGAFDSNFYRPVTAVNFKSYCPTYPIHAIP